MEYLELTFLGTGTSQGVPMIGCDCAVCLSDDPHDQRTRSSVLIKSPELSWVIDTGAEFRVQCLREKVTWLDAVLYTHAHSDHVLGFDDLRRFCDFLKGAIPVYGCADTLAALKRIYPFAFNGSRLPGYVAPDPRVIDGPFHLGNTEVIQFPVVHGSVPTSGYLFRRGGRPKLAYFSDCKELPVEHRALLKEVDTLVIDALRRRPHPTHMNLDEAIALSRELRPRRTYFTHLCHELPHQETQDELPDDIQIAWDGLRIQI